MTVKQLKKILEKINDNARVLVKCREVNSSDKNWGWKYYFRDVSTFRISTIQRDAGEYVQDKRNETHNSFIFEARNKSVKS
jgi:hypothetical protein